MKQKKHPKFEIGQKLMKFLKRRRQKIVSERVSTGKMFKSKKRVSLRSPSLKRHSANPLKRKKEMF